MTDERLKKIGERIKQERCLAGYKSQSEFALALSYSEDSRQTISKWESGKKLPSLEDFIKMCELFECEIGYLLCEYDCKTKDATNIHNAIGLSEKAISILHHICESSYQDTIVSFSKFIEHEKFFSLLLAMHTHVFELSKKSPYLMSEESNALAKVLNCSKQEAIEYINASSKALITSDFYKIVETIK